MGPLRTNCRSENSNELLSTPAFSAFLSSLIFPQTIFSFQPQDRCFSTNSLYRHAYQYKILLQIPNLYICVSSHFLYDTSTGIWNISDIPRQMFNKCILLRIYKSDAFPFVSYPLISPIDFGRVLKFKNVKYGRMSQLIADYPIRRTAALERDVFKSERKVTRRRGMRRKEQREGRTEAEESWPWSRGDRNECRKVIGWVARHIHRAKLRNETLPRTQFYFALPLSLSLSRSPKDHNNCTVQNTKAQIGIFQFLSSQCDIYYLSVWYHTERKMFGICDYTGKMY